MAEYDETVLDSVGPGGAIDHVSVAISDVARARAFYDAVLTHLGLVIRFEADWGVAYGKPNAFAQLWVHPPFEGEANAGNGVHIALRAPSRAAVDAFHAAGLAAGGVDAGAPGLRAHYHPDYYAAFLRDPDGNKIEAVTHTPAS
jgi:catechol 2,3-dioxygenase-like lactoylglutathione lyase family enzyme